MKKGIFILLVFACIIFFVSSGHKAYGAGFTVNTQGATSLGQANSVIAHTDDPSSVFFNPALIDCYHNIANLFLMLRNIITSQTKLSFPLCNLE